MISEHRSTSFESWSQSQLEGLEKLERAWHEGFRPRIEDYLAVDESDRAKLFREYLS